MLKMREEPQAQGAASSEPTRPQGVGRAERTFCREHRAHAPAGRGASADATRRMGPAAIFDTDC